MQIFIKTPAITSKIWAEAYTWIENITAAFPLKLVRLEGYNGYSPEIDKLHYDLVRYKGTPEEDIGFYGDDVSTSHSLQVYFSKHWARQKKYLCGKTQPIDKRKHIAWEAATPFKNDGSVPTANGQHLKRYQYYDLEGSYHRYAVAAIGIALENAFPDKFFFVGLDFDVDKAKKVIEWLEGHFEQDFEMPLYYDKPRLFQVLNKEYSNKKDLAERLEHLYRKEYMKNMTFAVENIGYEPAFEFYAEVLADSSFGTWGFSDVLDPWLAVTKDLESALHLVAASKHIKAVWLQELEGKQAILEARMGDKPKNRYGRYYDEDDCSLEISNLKDNLKEYDLTNLLKGYLKEYILWTPAQREILHGFYTNKQALETGDEGGIFGFMRRFMGMRVDICPAFATQDELFEAFMYHNPKNGKVFKKIIDEWVADENNSFETTRLKIEEAMILQQQKLEQQHKNDEDNEAHDAATTQLNDKVNDKGEALLETYAPHERFFIEKALYSNPAYPVADDALQHLISTVERLSNDTTDTKDNARLRSEPNTFRKERIRHYIKRDRLPVGVSFEQRLADETDDNVLFFLRYMLLVQVKHPFSYYARRQFLMQPELWDKVRK